MKCDVLVVGAGLAGLTVAERIANDMKLKVIVVDKRDHIGGNVYDFYNNDGILIHKYGPHIFHTNDSEVYEYLSRFTEWRQFEHFVLSSVDGKLVPMPVTLDTVNAIYGTDMNEEEMKAFLEKEAVSFDEIKTSEQVALSKVGPLLYEKLFKNYTKKQWGIDASELDTSVISRIPVRFNHDTRYFADTYQGMPLYGYTKMCEKMVESKNIKLLLKTDYKEIASEIQHRALVYTGRTDEFFHNFYGKLPYRSLDFIFETHDMEKFQEAPCVNYPNDNEYTRITEFKWMTGQTCYKTATCKLIPGDDGQALYPFPTAEYQAQFANYRKLMAKEKNTYFVGRLAEYKYYNMDKVVKRGLEVFEDMKKDYEELSTYERVHSLSEEEL
ncbi:MAG: UDP-galactopyranose mutase [Lachnospiraceae bacterium]|nr:UDP-galactopyranose mutase [Lachnospiraceae bacterium]